MSLLARMNSGPAEAPVSPRLEMGAYEALWLEKGATFKTLAEKFATDPSAVPSDFVGRATAEAHASEAMAKIKKSGVSRFGVRLNLTGNYPAKLRDARHPVEMLYFQGIWELAETRCVAIVGSRTATEAGKQRAGKIAKELVSKGIKQCAAAFSATISEAWVANTVMVPVPPSKIRTDIRRSHFESL